MRRSVGLAWVVGLALVLTGCAGEPADTATASPVTSIAAATVTSAATAATTTTTTVPPIVTGVGIGGGTINLAALLPLSGTLESFGRSVLEGHEVYWAYVNDVLGGVGGSYPVELLSLDTTYDEQTARSLWAAGQEDTLAISSVLGSPITDALLLEIGDRQILVAAGSQASSWSARPNVVLNLAIPAYRDQVAGAILHGGTETGLAAVDAPPGLLYREGVFGDDCVTGFERVTSRYETGEALSSGHPPTSTDFSNDLILMQEAGVETIFICSSPQTLLRIVATLDLLDYDPILIATAQSYDASLPEALGDQRGEAVGLELLSNVYLVGSWPPFEGDTSGMTLLKNNLSRYEARLPAPQTVDPWFFIGYTQAATFHVILEEAFAGRDLTRDGLWLARDRLGDVDFGFGAGPARYDDDRVPTVADVLSVPASAAESAFGMLPIGDYYPTR